LSPYINNIENKLILDFKGSLYQSNGTSNSRRVAIWIKKNVEFNLIDEYKDNERRLSFVHIIGSINVYYSVNSIANFDIYK
jgi:hypothetical protein